MAENTIVIPPKVEMYDKVHVREYLKKRDFLFFSWWQKVHTKTIKKELVIEIKSLLEPDVILYNGQEVELVPKSNASTTEGSAQ